MKYNCTKCGKEILLDDKHFVFRCAVCGKWYHYDCNVALSAETDSECIEVCEDCFKKSKQLQNAFLKVSKSYARMEKAQLDYHKQTNLLQICIDKLRKDCL